MDKRVIEWNLPLVEISKASRHEKSVRHGHPSTLHLWWARRPLASSRATILASLLELPQSESDQEAVLKLISDISPWDIVKTPNSALIAKGKKLIQAQWQLRPPKLLDPFSGGGSIPLEALRLGCETYASDLNPIAVLISKATLEWPQKLGLSKLADMVAYWADKVQQQVQTSLSIFYPSDPNGNIPIGYLWARTVPCANPQCNHDIPLIKHFWLARTKKRRIAYKPIINHDSNIPLTFIIQKDENIDFNPSEGTISKATVRCLFCKQVISSKTVRKFAKEGKLNQRMTIVILRNPSKAKKIYRPATSQDLRTYNEAGSFLLERIQKDKHFQELIPNEQLPPIGTLGFSVQNYGLLKWKDLFNERQLLSLIFFLKEIVNCSSFIRNWLELNHPNAQKKEKGLDKIILAYLTIILGRLTDKCSNLVIYNVYGEKIEHVFGRTALPMTWDYVELNVFSGANGDWSKQTEWVIRYLQKNSWNAPSKAIVEQASATNLEYPDNYFDAVITDPPYYDNVPYSDLSDFFYVWFKRAVGGIFPKLFSTPLTPKNLEIVANKGRQENPKEFFESLLSRAFQEFHRVLAPTGIAIFVYAHKSTKGWETMLEALIRAGFTITSSWPIHTEMKTRLRARTSAALASSIYLVCRKGEQQSEGYLREIVAEAEKNISTRLKRFWSDGIRGGDFFISAIGPGMEIFSRYQTIMKYSGEKVSVADQLVEIRKISTSFLFQILTNSPQNARIDEIGQFYLAFRWTYGESTVDYGEVQKLSQAYGIDLKQHSKSDGFVTITGSQVTIKSALQRTIINTENHHLVDLMHQAVLAWKSNDKEMLIQLFDSTIKSVRDVFGPFCQAVAECLPPHNQEKQLLEGLLVSQFLQV
ncbi:MAG: DUF1156 domain-containing protein [Candidatus Hodarchaeales archaeon]